MSDSLGKRLLPLAALLLLGACEKQDQRALEDTWNKVSGASDAALSELKKLSPDEAGREFRKLRQFEYRVFTMSADSSADALAARLNAEGQDFWECFHIERQRKEEQENFLVFCRRRPDTPLKFVPQTILSR